MEHHHQQHPSNNNNNESEDNGMAEEYEEEAHPNVIGTGLRRRKGKIISCAKETIENASRLIRRRVPCAGHLMTPRRLWLNKIPTQCDVVLEFPELAPDEVLRWLLGRIRAPPPQGLGLVVQIRSHESTKRTAFYLTAPINILFKAAEEARLPKRLREDLGGDLREFTTRESHCFAQIKDNDGGTALFTSQERQWLVLQILQGLRAGPNDMDVLKDKAIVAEGQSIVAAWQESGLITQVFPLHETSALTQLQSSWVRNVFAPQPLDDIAEYFGVKVALYFAWLGHYTCALGVPAVFGTILWAGLYGRGQTAQDIGHVLFSLFNVAWASLYLEAWRRYSVELAFRWGTLSTPPELLEPPRPLYKGPLVESPVTGRLEPREAPAWQRRAFRYLVSFPVIGLCLLLVFVVMFLMLRFQDWWDEKLPETGLLSCLSVIPKVLLAGAITLMDEAYFKLAVWLNDRENYRLQSKYENHLIAKVALFQFVNSFLSLFYIAFYLRDQEQLKEQLAGLLISRQIIGNLRESAWPYMMEQWRLATLSFQLWGALSPTQPTTDLKPEPAEAKKDESQAAAATNSEPTKPDNLNVGAGSEENKEKEKEKEAAATLPKRTIGQAEIESSLFKYDGTFSDHLEMLVQMGYVVLFSAAFPLAGLCALANNLLEIRSDAFKLAHVHQRPFGQRVANIGTWQNALGLLGLAAVIVNCALIGLSGQVSRLWPGLTSTQTVILIVALEHVMLGLRSALTWLLPELPSWLAAEIARAEHCRREMQCKGTSPRPTPPSPPSSTSASHQELDTTNTPEMYKVYESSTDNPDLEDFNFEQYMTNSPLFSKPGSSLIDSVFDEISNSKQPQQSSPPESPISQTSTVLIRPLLESSANSSSSIHNLPGGHEESGGGGHSSSPSACRHLKQSDIADIPPFRGHSVRNTAKKHASRHTSIKAVSQPIHIPEIPPFRKRNNSQPHSNITPPHHGQTHSPPAAGIQQIPPFKPRKSSQDSWNPAPSDIDHHLTIGAVGIPDWAKRLKTSEPTPIHRSTDCIAKELASHGIDNEALKNAPSWTTVHLSHQKVEKTEKADKHEKTEKHEKSEKHEKVEKSEKPEKSEKTEKHIPTSSTSGPATAGTSSSGTSTTHPGTSHEDEEAKAAELAAKKSRIKQSLVKRARSVAIFSLKLKERRAREAEKAAQAAIEHAKIVASVNMPPPGGELSFLPIEQLIQVDDVVKHRNSASGSGTAS